MRVLIVAKTRMATGACIGGFRLEDNQLVRLLPEHGVNHCMDTEYQVGQLWEMDLAPVPQVHPPHVEDMRIHQCKLVGNQSHLAAFILKRVKPWRGSPQVLFDGLLQATLPGSGYISQKGGIPKHSTGFWVPDRNLNRADYNSKVRFHYPADSGVRYLSYVGFDAPVNFLRAGTLVRVSLARWWRPGDNLEVEERCYLQLSGWYLN